MRTGRELVIQLTHMREKEGTHQLIATIKIGKGKKMLSFRASAYTGVEIRIPEQGRTDCRNQSADWFRNNSAETFAEIGEKNCSGQRA